VLLDRYRHVVLESPRQRRTAQGEVRSLGTAVPPGASLVTPP
jgi:hypothetical protein